MNIAKKTRAVHRFSIHQVLIAATHHRSHLFCVACLVLIAIVLLHSLPCNYTRSAEYLRFAAMLFTFDHQREEMKEKSMDMCKRKSENKTTKECDTGRE
jgi:hypothetical protein